VRLFAGLYPELAFRRGWEATRFQSLGAPHILDLGGAAVCRGGPCARRPSGERDLAFFSGDAQ